MGPRAPECFAGWRRWWIVRWLRTRVFDPTVAVLRKFFHKELWEAVYSVPAAHKVDRKPRLKRGAEPKQLALSVAVGVTSGLCPLFGLTAVLCGFLALLLRRHCHPPTMMLANFAATPLELSLLIPFMRLGELVTSSPRLSISPKSLLEALGGGVSKRLLASLCHAVLGWALATLPITCTLYYLILPLIRQITKRTSSSLPSNQLSAESPRLPTRNISPRRPAPSAATAAATEAKPQRASS